MENEYANALENYDSEYISESLSSDSGLEYVQPPETQDGAVGLQPQYIQQPIYVQQPVYTQPVIAQPIYTQPIYTQPFIMQQPMMPVAQSFVPQQNRGYLTADELKAARWHAHPVLVFFALLLCFPVGLILLLFFTKWGVFPKIFITLFSLSCILAIYEVLAFYSIFNLPSLLGNIL